MARTHFRSKRKISGGRYRDFRKKRLCDVGRDPTLTKLENFRRKMIRIKGGGVKFIILSSNLINLYSKKEKKYKKAKIKTVVENPANRNYVRRNILTKGTIVETDIGKAKITSRPGQEGAINGVLIE